VKAKDYPDYLMDCSKYLTYQKYEKGDYIFHKGDIGNKMYIILEGNVSIFIPKSLIESEVDADRLKEGLGELYLEDPNFKFPSKEEALVRVKGEFSRRTYLSLKNDFSFDEYLAMILVRRDKFPWISDEDFLTLGIGKQAVYYKQGVFEYKAIATLGENKIFGDLALIRNAPRNATIIAKNSVTMLSLSKASFEKIFSSTLKSEGQKIQFFEQLFGARVGKQHIIGIQNLFKERTYQRGSYIFKEGDPIDNIYLIRCGDVMLFKESPPAKVSLFLHEKAECLKREFHIPQNQNHTAVGIVSSSSFLGEDDHVNGTQVRTYSAQAVTSPTSIYAIDTKVFESSKQKIFKFLLEDLS
jgi:CRP-like cAMP-binding protein